LDFEITTLGRVKRGVSVTKGSGTMKFFITILTIIVIGTVIWVPFALWMGFYSVYSYPPSKEHPKGATLLVHREEAEPMFNSPDYVPEKHEPQPDEKRGGIGFQGAPTTKRSLQTRTIVELPYVDWAYKKSIMPKPANK